MRLWLSALLSAFLLATVSHATDPKVRSAAYTELASTRAAFRQLTRDSITGTSTPRTGTRGALFLVNDTKSANALIASLSRSNPARLAAVIESGFFTPTYLRKLAAPPVTPGALAGIFLLPGAPPADPDGFSPDELTPNGDVDIHGPAAVPFGGVDAKYTWNKPASSLRLEAFSFPIVSVNGAAAVSLRDDAVKNLEWRNRGDHAGFTAHMRYFMFSEKNSPHCFGENNCYPIGGHSVWSRFGPAPPPEPDTDDDTPTPPSPAPPGPTPGAGRPSVWAVTQGDATAFFPGRAHGGDAAAAGLVVLLSAAAALSKVQGVNALERDIVFAVFDGEKNDYIGSRRLIGDLLGGFKCNPAQMKNGTGPYGEKNYPVSCEMPYRIDLAALQLLDGASIAAAIEVAQPALSPFLYAHIEKNSTSAPALVTTIKTAAATTPLPYPPPGFTEVRDASPATPGVPPSSLQSLIAARRWAAPPDDVVAAGEAAVAAWRDLPVVVLADHEAEYVNKYYGSKYDDAQNISKDRGFNQLCASATLLARSLLITASPSTPPSPATLEALAADCNLVIELVACLTDNLGCPLFNRLAPGAFGTAVANAADAVAASGGTATTNLYAQNPPSLFSSIYVPRRTSQVTGLPKVLRAFLDEAARNATAATIAPEDEKAWKRLNNSRFAFYYDAVDVGIELDRDTQRFVVVDSPNDNPKWGFSAPLPWPPSRLWAESNWDSTVGVTIYRTEARGVIIATAVAGAALAVAAFFAATAIKRCARRLYKET